LNRMAASLTRTRRNTCAAMRRVPNGPSRRSSGCSKNICLHGEAETRRA
jgi:hypothetical protein